jgi:hypothetical protein
MEIGKEINLKFLDGKTSSSKPTSNAGNIANDFGIDINVIE